MKIVTPLTHDDALKLWNEAEIQDSTIAGAVVKLLMAVDVASREQTREAATSGLVPWLEENVRKCDHGYVFVTCGPCMSAWIGTR